MSSLLLSSSFLPFFLPNPLSRFSFLNPTINQVPPTPLSIIASSSSTDTLDSSSHSPRLVTFLGKGGSGKTTSAVFAAQHYAMAGLRTCLVIQTQDPSADSLLNCKIGTTPVICNQNLSAVRLETTKMLLEPLNRLKQADARLKITQGILEGVDSWRGAWRATRNGFNFWSNCA